MSPMEHLHSEYSMLPVKEHDELCFPKNHRFINLLERSRLQRAPYWTNNGRNWLQKSTKRAYRYSGTTTIFIGLQVSHPQ